MNVPSRKRITRGAMLAGFSLTLLCGGSQAIQAVPLPPWVQASLAGGQVQLEWATQPGTLYEIQSRTNLSSGSWVTVDSVAAQGLQATWTESLAPSGGRYYRIFMPQGEVSLVEPPERPPAQPCNCGGASAQPATQPNLYLFSGEFHLDAEDLRIPGRGFDFIWARKYRSRLGPDTVQGNGWDFSYNVSARRLGPYIEVRDGNTRRDLYTPQPDGSYGADGLFTEGRVTNETLTVRFSDNGRWEFHPFTSPGVGGKIKQSVDRNGNTMRFEYDGLSRLVRVVDTLNRTNVISYNADGFISAVTDFSGRQVKYFYYQNADADGALGDLRHVVSPVVTNTPNGNDFPNGKTNTYTYSKGQPQPALNGNLITITNGRGQMVVSNRYHSVTTVTNRDFDTLEIEIVGMTLQGLKPARVPIIPDATNNFSSQKTILNDRAGNVKELYFDPANRPVMKREFTGRADPHQPTTEALNRPINPLRPGDPAFFETRYVWNADSLPKQIIYPNGNSVSNVYEFDLDPLMPRRARGNLRERHRLPGPLGGDQAELVDRYEYDTSFGGCCGFNFVTKHTDPRTNITLHAYDARGNRTNTLHAVPGVVEDWEYNAYGQVTAHISPENGSGHRRRDEFIYYASGPQTGYRQSQIMDNTGFALTTTYQYDAVGNLIRLIDPDGFDTLYTVNALNQTVRAQSPLLNTSNGPVRYEQLVWFDADNNRVREDGQNIDDAGVIQPNAWFSSTQEFDELNQLVRAVREVDATHSVTNEFVYDANQNRVLMRFPEAVKGNDPFNTITNIFDERDLLFRETHAPGGADQSTTQHDYDGNRNVTQRLHGLEAGAHTEVYTYDGYNRRVTRTDAMGNLTRTYYDAASNVATNRVEGELTDVPGSAGNVRLSETTYQYDAMDRRIRTDTAFFDTQTQTPIADGFVTTLEFFAPNSQLTATVDDNNRTNCYYYDSANRRIAAIDPKGNSNTNTYDARGNVTVRTGTDKSDVGNPDEVTWVQFVYDEAGRLSYSYNNLYITNRYTYDSRHNRRSEMDGRGNTTRYEYDGLDRLIRSNRQMTDTGTGSGVVVDFVTTFRAWDDNSRLRSQTDDNTNTTQYAYDGLDRRIRTEFADGTGQTNTFDTHGNRTRFRDANGNVVTSDYDANDRLRTNRVTRGAGVLGTTNEVYQYDGMSRLVRAQNDDSIVMRFYNSQSRVTEEIEQVPPAPAATNTATYDGVGNQTRLVYPSGRAIARTYDSVNLVSMVLDDPPLMPPSIAVHSYVGRRVQRTDYGNGIRGQFVYDPIRRPMHSVYFPMAGGPPVDDRMYGWDTAHNKQVMSVLSALPPENRNYAYDSADRLIRSTIAPNPATEYQLDGVGNRTNVLGAIDPGLYSMDATLPEPADFQVNQYTTTPFDNRLYDRNGNLKTANAANYTYDFRNRLIRANVPGVNAVYKYDCLSRRIERSVNGVITRHYYASQNEIEERNVANLTTATYVSAGPGVDNDDSEVVFCSLLQMTRGGQNYYHHGDDMGSIVKITDAAGVLKEQYEYGDYGKPTIKDGVGVPLSTTAIGNPYLFQGMRYESETTLYLSLQGEDALHFDPRSGRYVSRAVTSVPSLAEPAVLPWVSDLDPNRFGEGPWTTSFHPGIVRPSTGARNEHSRSHRTGENHYAFLANNPLSSSASTAMLASHARVNPIWFFRWWIKRMLREMDPPPQSSEFMANGAPPVSPKDLTFQTDGPIICQALFQRLSPRPPPPPPQGVSPEPWVSPGVVLQNFVGPVTPVDLYLMSPTGFHPMEFDPGEATRGGTGVSLGLLGWYQSGSPGIAPRQGPLAGVAGEAIKRVKKLFADDSEPAQPSQHRKARGTTED